MDHKSLRRRCEQKLREVQLPQPFDVTMFCEWVAEASGRPIILHAVDTPGTLFGAWLCTESTDYIMYDRQTSPIHQEQIILHEACHILLEHEGLRLSESDATAMLFPDLHSDMLSRVLHRGSYSSLEDREAELLASLILQRAERNSQVATPIRDGEAAGILRRIQQLNSEKARM